MDEKRCHHRTNAKKCFSQQVFDQMKPFFSWNTHTQDHLHIAHASRGIPDKKRMTRRLGGRSQWARDWPRRIVHVSYPYSPGCSEFILNRAVGIRIT
jgi:hypothetical protein